jgi:type II secretory pathway pseudopilin PulG
MLKCLNRAHNSLCAPVNVNTKRGLLSTFSKSGGFTLLEVIVAISLITVGMIGISSLITQTISSARFSFQKLTAAYLAQEGIEIVRNIRDKNWLEGATWNQGLGDCGSAVCEYEADYESPSLRTYLASDYLNINTNGFYGYPSDSSALPRKITIFDKVKSIFKNRIDIGYFSKIFENLKQRIFSFFDSLATNISKKISSVKLIWKNLASWYSSKWQPKGKRDTGTLKTDFVEVEIEKGDIPRVRNTDLLGSGTDYAILSGIVEDNGYTDSNVLVQVWICWGESDGGTAVPPKGSWDDCYKLPVEQGEGIQFSHDTGHILKPNITYFYRCYAKNAIGDDWADSATSFTTEVAPPKIKNTGYSEGDITTNSANLHGEIDTGGENPAVWVYYGENNCVTDKACWEGQHKFYLGPKGAGSFSKRLTGLSAGTTYFYRWYAEHPGGEFDWSDEEPFSFETLSTIQRPTVTNYIGAIDIKYNSATLTGKVDDNGGEDPTVTICWGESDGGTAVPPKGSWDDCYELPGTQSGAFSHPISNLTPDTPYSYRCYAKNKAGSDWTDDTDPKISFTTLPSPITPAVSNTGVIPGSITSNSAILTGKVTDAGNENPDVWVCWGKNDGGISAPPPGTWENCRYLETKGEETFSLGVTGLEPETTYSYRCYAKNSAGDIWTSLVTFDTLAALPFEPTKFRRKITILDTIDLDGDGSIDRMMVRVEISWEEKGKTYHIEAQENLYNWR